ncbi:hypothetical protein Lal_00036657 [Lupinus albus]|nr:hypothetical protein Lal_00036657 [Lupinus albus]
MDHINPGAIIHSILTLKKDHVSTSIWNEGDVTFRARYNVWQNLPSKPHAIDRVMREFVLQQPIPQDLINLEKQNKMNLQGENDYNRLQKHDQWIQKWNNQEKIRKYISPDEAYSAGS